MMLVKVKEQDGILNACELKFPSIPTSAACCDDLQQMGYTFNNSQLLY